MNNNDYVPQCTIKRAIDAIGVGLHTGSQVLLTLKPAPVNTGIIFYRSDIAEKIPIPALAKYVSDTRLSTSIAYNNYSVATIEHLLSAIAGLGIDNLIIEVSSLEVPIMDGSSSPYVFLLQGAGILVQNAPKKFIRITKKVMIEDNGKWAYVEPYDGFKVTIKLNFSHPVMQKYSQESVLEFSSISYIKEVSRSRTFGFMSEYEWLKANNLALGGSLRNAVVIDDTDVINEEGLRSKDEFVKHKLLDAIGDLYLLGHQMVGSFVSYRGGHDLNNKLIKKLLQERSSWKIVNYTENNSPLIYNQELINTKSNA